MKQHTDNPANLAREIIQATILGAIISSPRKSSVPTGSDVYDKIKVRPIELKNGACFQLEQFRGQKVFHRNVNIDELSRLIELWLGKEYSRAEFSTATETIQVLANKRGELSALKKKATSVPHAEKIHNRTKNYILQEGIPVPFLIDLDVMTNDGHVIKSKYDKFRQINRFLEFIADVLPELRRVSEENNREIRIIDFGCGKSYLTFAVYYYLSVLQKLPVNIIGLDLKDDVITHCTSLAQKYHYDGLHFEIGNIADYSKADTTDMVISLHACDTATDFALAQAVRWKAQVILSVPCCQHELNAQIAARRENGTEASVLDPAFKHGIIRERISALFTDVLRAELLESQGYKVQILEFIDMSHTPKNLLIRAVKNEKTTEHPNREKYYALRDFLGVEPTLEKEFPNG